MPAVTPSTLPSLPADPAEARADGWAALPLPALLAFLVLASHLYFYNGAWQNQNARLNAVFTFVEPGPNQYTFRMDDFMLAPERALNTIDWSYCNGHYYANKAPGTMVFGVVPYFLLYHLEEALGMNAESSPLCYLNAFLLNLVLTVLAAALAAPVFYGLVRSVGRTTRRTAVGLTIILFWGTMMFSHSTQLWGHVTAAACWIGALAGFAAGTWRGMLRAGWWAGLAVFCEYFGAVTLGVFLLVLGGLLLLAAARSWRRDGATSNGVWREPARQLGAFLLGGVVPLLAYLVYHRVCFGHWLTTANHFQNPVFNQAGRALGMFGAFNPGVLIQLTCLPFRGLFVSSPVLLLALPGFYFWLRRGPRRELAVLCLGVLAANLVMNASFNGWHGGGTFGPRYLISTLPFLVLTFAWLPPAPRWHWLAGGLFAVSLVFMLAVTVTCPVASDRADIEGSPVFIRLRMWADGRYTSQKRLPVRNEWLRLRDWSQPVPEDVALFSAFNVGQFLGLRGHACLLPWFLLVGGGFFVTLRAAARADAEAAKAPGPAPPLDGLPRASGAPG